MEGLRTSRGLVVAVLLCGLGLGACGPTESGAMGSGAELEESAQSLPGERPCDLTIACVRPESSILCDNGFWLIGMPTQGGYCYRRDGCGDGTPLCQW